MPGQHFLPPARAVFVWFLGIFFLSHGMTSARVLNRYIRHYEPLSYRPLTDLGGRRPKRSLSAHNDNEKVHFTFRALNRCRPTVSAYDGGIHLANYIWDSMRLFRLRLAQDRSSFSNDFVMVTSRGAVNASLDHIYSGHVADVPGSRVVGAVTDGVFVGHIALPPRDEFHVERASRYFGPRHRGFHSVIYSAKDAYAHDGRCGLHGATESFLNNLRRPRGQRKMAIKEPQGRRRRPKRSALDSLSKSYGGPGPVWASNVSEFKGRGDAPQKRGGNSYMKRVCNLEILVDHTLFQSVLEDSNGEEEKARETITSIIHTHTASVSEIFKGTSFNGITDIVFEVQRVQVNDSSSCEGRVRRTNPFCRDDLDATHALLELSKINHEHFCASYLWTHRDFQGGTLGLAFLAEAGSDTGGICDLHHFGANVDVASKYHGELSLNTGIVTFLNNNIRLSQRDTEITFAHELGHSFGSPHDMSPDCTPGGTEGNFLMYPSARRGIEPNNRKFSECSIRNISSFLHELLAGEGESPNCLQEPRGPFCGNSVREKGEQCDCGYDSTDCVDRCCYPRASGDDKACKLRPNALCSPANDACCTKDCVFRGSTASCRPEDECRLEAFCDGASADCPASLWRPNGTECNLGTQLCEAGECMRSVCHKFGLVQCFLTGPDKSSEERCLLACRKDAPGSECKEACHFDQMAHLCHKKLQPGAACDDLHGYCDVFHRCRPLDAEGPLTRLQWLVFGRKGLTNVLLVYWYLTLLGFIIVGVLTVLLVRLCSVYTPSSNPQLKPNKKLLTNVIRHPLDDLLEHFRRIV